LVIAVSAKPMPIPQFSSLRDDLEKIGAALGAAANLLHDYVSGRVAVADKGHAGPVTEADIAVNELLQRRLLRRGEGWLSEETVDDPDRIRRRRVWVVDPLDGTREFIQGIPEWCVSVGLVEDGRAVAGGICNPITGQTFLGSLETGVMLNGTSVRLAPRRGVAGATVLASRTEVDRGEWEQFAEEPFEVRPMGSVAYKLALVAAGLADATWTLVPKHEWDVAAGVALVLAGGGEVWTLKGQRPVFNRPSTLLEGLVATGTLASSREWDEYLHRLLCSQGDSGGESGRVADMTARRGSPDDLASSEDEECPMTSVESHVKGLVK
jgi:myo-inositol-1(or 4)-monophosphatase